MFEKLKTNLAIKWLEQNKDAPKMSLNSTDKLYLAVSKKSVGNLIYIYTLGNTKANHNQWNVNTTISVKTFDKKSKAEVYYKTLVEIMKLQHKNPGVQVIVDVFKEEIKRFKENTR